MHLLSKKEDMHFTNCYLKNISNHPELLLVLVFAVQRLLVGLIVVEQIRKEVKTILYEKALKSLLPQFMLSFVLLIPYFSYRGTAQSITALACLTSKAHTLAVT